MEDGKDPIEKMNELRSWLKSNRVGTYAATPKTTGGIRITGELSKPPSVEASREIADFEQWVNEIQAPPLKAWFAQ